MSQRLYVKNVTGTVDLLIESIGPPTDGKDGEDVWGVTVVIHGTPINLRGTLWTSEVKTLVGQLEADGWKKEAHVEKDSET